MSVVTIHTPIWGTKSVGVAKDKIIVTDKLIVKIDYKDKNGDELYPYYLMMSGNEALQYPSQTVRGTELKIIPIQMFQKMKLKKDVELDI